MKMIQIRNVPDRVHRKLKARAAIAGMSLSEYLLRELRELAERPTLDEMLERLPSYDDVLSPSPASLIREDRERR